MRPLIGSTSDRPPLRSPALPTVESSTITHTLSVLVDIDLDGTSVQLHITGCLTEANQHVLHPLIRRARTLTPSVHVEVDLASLQHLEPTAVTLLQSAVDHEGSSAESGSVRVSAPDGVRAHPAPRKPSSRPSRPAHVLSALAA